MVFQPPAMTNAQRTLAKDVLHCGLFGVMETRKAEDLSGGPLSTEERREEIGGVGPLSVHTTQGLLQWTWWEKSGKVGD